MTEFDPATCNIFERRHSVYANACVGGNGYVDAETYAVGYFEATRLLLRLVLNRKNGLTQDTLVYPILFNFRHGIELNIKRVAKVLHDCGISTLHHGKITHDLDSLWEGLKEQSRVDRRLIQSHEDLTPVVRQLHEADPLAQEFRYPEANDGVPSFEGKRIVDLMTVLELVDYAELRFASLFRLADTIAHERQFGSYTDVFNREELRQLSIELPPADTWGESNVFDKVKEKWIAGYGISVSAFSRAVGFIKKHREFASNVGIMGSFIALDDDALDRLIHAANELRLHNLKDNDSGELLEVGIEDILNDPTEALFDSATVALSAELVAEVNAIFYLGRDCIYSELYEAKLETHSFNRKEVFEDALRREILHVFEKFNFVSEMSKGLRMIGRPDLSEIYAKLLED